MTFKYEQMNQEWVSLRKAARIFQNNEAMREGGGSIEREREREREKWVKLITKKRIMDAWIGASLSFSFLSSLLLSLSYPHPPKKVYYKSGCNHYSPCPLHSSSRRNERNHMSPRARKQDWMDGIPHLLSLSFSLVCWSKFTCYLVACYSSECLVPTS